MPYARIRLPKENWTRPERRRFYKNALKIYLNYEKVENDFQDFYFRFDSEAEAEIFRQAIAKELAKTNKVKFS